MAISVEIDPHSGFCGGVIRAIGKAEAYLDAGGAERHLYSLGAIVHNEAELGRLSAKGLVTIDKEDLAEMRGTAQSGETILIRAHGEPPGTYIEARQKGFDIIDCTCPVVLQLQHSIREAYARLHREGRGGRLVIFGKIGHAEVLGLVGQVGGDAIVIEDKAMLLEAIDSGQLDLTRPIEIFSQTTKSPSDYAEICSLIEVKMAREFGMELYRFRGSGRFRVHNTICSQVASRHSRMIDFSLSHDIIVFVSGKSSSNGKVLCDLCKSVNIRTYYVGSTEEIRLEWFRPDDRVGVCGATSTPKWLLDEIAAHIASLAEEIDARHAHLSATVGQVNLQK